eukprot:scaffold4742_cov84-Skeletonema_marinoi.AAC.2
MFPPGCHRRLDQEEEDRKSERGIATIVNINNLSMSSISSVPSPQGCVGTGSAAYRSKSTLALARRHVTKPRCRWQHKQGLDCMQL